MSVGKASRKLVEEAIMVWMISGSASLFQKKKLS